jgi:hypothetical protein
MTTLQNYVDAIAQITASTFSLSTVRTGANSAKVPNVDEELWVNFDDSNYQLDRAVLAARIKAVAAAATATELTLKDIRKVSDRVEFFLAEFEKIGVKGLDKTDLLLILFDAASVRDWGFVSPQMQALIDKLAPLPTTKK